MSVIGESDIEAWRGAIGRTAHRRQRLDIESLRRFALAIGLGADVERVRPALAHWAWFLDAAADEDIGEDGHPKRGGFLPDIPLPRRMFAAADIRFLAPLDVDREAELTLRIADVRHKAGRTGDLVFVDVDRTLAQAGSQRIQERQTLVYRLVDSVRTPAPIPTPNAGYGEVWRPGPVNLFRFSAATFNGHRIHYDQPYATVVEGYPALVVHGPFTAAKLAEIAARRGTLSHFAFQARAALFVDQPIRLHETEAGGVQAIRCDGAVAVTATAAWI